MNFDKNKTKGIDINGFELSTKKGCDKFNYTVGDTAISDENFYFEVKIKVGACYSAIGFTNEKSYLDNSQQTRLGEDQNSWGLRVYGNHSDKSFSGAIHNNIHQSFFQDFVDNDVVGCFLNLNENTISYYLNGKLLGTPFNEVKGEAFYPVIHICHSNLVFTVNFEAELNDVIPSSSKKTIDKEETFANKKAVLKEIIKNTPKPRTNFFSAQDGDTMYF
jgi:hypothetical protein